MFVHAAQDIDGSRRALSHAHGAIGDSRMMAPQVWQRKRGVKHSCGTGIRGDRAGVANLSSRFGVKRGAV